jgi:hypothetical protein
LSLTKLLIQLLKKPKKQGYGRQQISKRMDGTEYLTNQASRLIFPDQYGKQLLIINS